MYVRTHETIVRQWQSTSKSSAIEYVYMYYLWLILSRHWRHLFVNCIFSRTSINLLTVRSGSTWTMYFIKALVGLGFPFGFRLSHSSLETPSSRAKCNQFFFPGVSSPASKIATFSKQSIFSSRVTIVSLSAKWESYTHQQSINQLIN